MLFALKVVLSMIALLHVWTVILEMVLWTHPIGLRVFGQKKEVAESSAVLAKNQGLYNGFLVVALLLGVALPEPLGNAFRLYGLGCVLVAGVYGGLTAKRSILLFQAAPAAVALVLAYLAA
jgi:putative membrane protein